MESAEINKNYRYKKTLASDGIVGLYRGFVPSVIGIIIYRGTCEVIAIKFAWQGLLTRFFLELDFGSYDTLKETLLVGSLQGNFLASFALGWATTVREIFQI